jgi:hypothetical protein
MFIEVGNLGKLSVSSSKGHRDWWREGSLIDVDFSNDLFRFNNLNYNSLEDFLTITGGKFLEDGTIKLGPVMYGDNLYDFHFDSSTEGWVDSGNPATTTVSYEDGKVKVVVATGGANGNSRGGVPVTVNRAKAYQFGGRFVSWTNIAAEGSISIGQGSLAFKIIPAGSTQGDACYLVPGVVSVGVAAPATTIMYIGPNTSSTVPRTEYWDDFFLRQAAPVLGYEGTNGISGIVEFTTPISDPSTDQVIWQADDDASIGTKPSESNRHRLVWDSSKHVRFIVTANAVEVTNIDLGVVENSTSAKVRYSLGLVNDAKANLNGTVLTKDTSSVLVGVAAFRFRRGNAGYRDYFAGFLAEAPSIKENVIFPWIDSSSGNHTLSVNPDGDGYWKMTCGQVGAVASMQFNLQQGIAVNSDTFKFHIDAIHDGIDNALILRIGTFSNGQDILADTPVVNGHNEFNFSAPSGTTANLYFKLTRTAVGSSKFKGVKAYPTIKANEFLGTIDRVTIFNSIMPDSEFVDPEQAFMVYGDSTANGDNGGPPKWYDVLRTSYTPIRSVAEAAQGGENSTQMLAHVEADTDHLNWTTIFMDRPNTAEDVGLWASNIKQATSFLKTNRWFVVPPVLNSPMAVPDNSEARLLETQDLLLSDPFFFGHTFDADEQEAYSEALIDDSMRSDGVHFNTAGQAEQAAHIKNWLNSKGW